MLARWVTLALEGFRYFLGASGGLTTDWVVWSLVWWLTGSAEVAQGISRACGAVVAFLLHRNFSFRAGSGDARAQARRFVVAAAGGWVVSLLLVASLSTLMPDLLAKFLSDGVTFSINWFVMRLWVFRIGKDSNRAPPVVSAG